MSLCFKIIRFEKNNPLPAPRPFPRRRPRHGRPDVLAMAGRTALGPPAAVFLCRSVDEHRFAVLEKIHPAPKRPAVAGSVHFERGVAIGGIPAHPAHAAHVHWVGAPAPRRA